METRRLISQKNHWNKKCRRDENPSETRENIEGTDSSEGSREETVKKEFEPRSETREESGFDLDKLFDQKERDRSTNDWTNFKRKKRCLERSWLW